MEHPLHPGLGWVEHRLLGDALDLGLGLLGLDPAHPDRPAPLPGGVAADAGLETDEWWHDALDYLEDMGTMAVLRWRRNPDDPIRPMGDCDVVTLLGSRILRHAVAAHHQGLAPVAVPMRTRGWLDLSRIDPAFVLAAAGATAEADLGLPAPAAGHRRRDRAGRPRRRPGPDRAARRGAPVPAPRAAGRQGSLGA